MALVFHLDCLRRFSMFHKGPGAAERISLDTRLRWMGMFFQFAGLAGVIYGLKESRQIFNRPSFSTMIKAWGSELVEIFRKPVPRNASLEARTLVAASSIGSPRLIVNEGLEEKVSRIERELGEFAAACPRRFQERRPRSQGTS